MQETQDTLVVARNLRKHFPLRGGFLSSGQKSAVRAVDGIDLTVARGETLGLVGESGCGKSTTARLLIRLIEPSSGTIRFDGVDLLSLSARDMQRQRRRMQIVFQDPVNSLNPRFTVGQIVAEPLEIFGEGDRAWRRRRVAELLGLVGLSAGYAGRYPHEFSGGQRQRVGIARALALNPDFVICDEPVSALDVSVQAQVITLLQDLQERLSLTFLFVAHDLSVVKHVSDRVAVMYLGKIVELARKDRLFASPHHPYTQALISAVPSHQPHRKTQRVVLKGDLPSPVDPPSGCRFHTRCPFAEALCREQEPVLKQISEGHEVACHFAGSVSALNSQQRSRAV